MGNYLAPEDAVRELRVAVRKLNLALKRVPLEPDHEIKNWPLCTPEQEFGGGVWCADEDCPLMAENSEIGDFREGTFTLEALHQAIGEHIAARRDREEE